MPVQVYSNMCHSFMQEGIVHAALRSVARQSWYVV
jgi:hypothetical protein